ncbi:MAG: LPXTG cell wall anchor domain-containing protein [Firmicutes bacterium]|nr:LPXTG cell wall anchor domain-containing protein [Bacillota bacterium]
MTEEEPITHNATWVDEDGKETGDVIYTAVYKPIDVPNTGDMARPELWIVAGILSMLGFVLLARKRREEE